jgi:putative membrane protein
MAPLESPLGTELAAMPWIKAWHVIFMVTWFAGLFYLPRLFVYHAATTDRAGQERFCVMERRLFAIMTIGAALTAVFGLWLLARNPVLLQTGWMRTKLVLVLVLAGYHAWCWRLLRDFAAGRNARSGRWYRWFNEAPSLLLIGIVLLAVARPF